MRPVRLTMIQYLAQLVVLNAYRVRVAACVALLATLGACGTSHVSHTATHYNPSRYYPPPGSAEDPWRPYIHEASGRFGVPEVWIRRVMHQESGGQEDVISWAGAMGLMQVMPETYDGLRGRYNLGDDPFDPHNNILAGTAYLREMYDRYGAPGFLAAYNAGPNRLDRYLSNGAPLPSETVNYVASIAPLLGPETPMSGPLAVYAGGGPVAQQFAARPTPAGCDPDAAYNPDGPCTPLAPAMGQTASAATPAAMADCDLDAAYDPTRPCRTLPTPPMMAEPIEPLPSPPPPPRTARRYMADARPIQETMAQRAVFSPGPPPGRWMIQVGAFATLTLAEAAAKNARLVAPDLLRMTKIELPATAPLGTQVAFRARLSGLTAAAAADACSRLIGHRIKCIAVPPPRESF